jgi:hypothetical protein
MLLDPAALLDDAVPPVELPAPPAAELPAVVFALAAPVAPLAFVFAFACAACWLAWVCI